MATALPLPLHASPASHFPAQQHGCWERRGGGSRGLEIPVPAVLQVRHLPSSCIWSSHNHCSDFSATVSSICSSSHGRHILIFLLLCLPFTVATSIVLISLLLFVCVFPCHQLFTPSLVERWTIYILNKNERLVEKPVAVVQTE